MQVYNDESLNNPTKLVLLCERVDLLTKQINALDPHVHEINNKITSVMNLLTGGSISEDQFLAGLEAKFVQSIWSVQKKQYELSRLSTQEAELTNKKIDNIKEENKQQQTFKFKYEKLKNHLELLDIQFIKDRKLNERQFKEASQASARLALELGQLKTVLNGKIDQSALLELTKQISSQYITTESCNQILDAVEQRFKEHLESKATVDDLRRFSNQLEQLGNYNFEKTLSIVERQVNNQISLKLQHVASQEQIEGLQKQIFQAREHFSAGLSKIELDVNDTLKAMSIRFKQQFGNELEQIKESLESLQLGMKAINQKTNASDFNLNRMLDEVRKNLGPGSEALYKLQSDLNNRKDEQLSLEQSILSLFSLKADNDKLEKYIKEIEEKYVQKDKAADMLFRVSYAEDQLKSLYLSMQMIQPQMDKLQDQIDSVFHESLKETEKAFSTQQQILHKFDHRFSDISTQIESKAERTEMIQLYDAKTLNKTINDLLFKQDMIKDYLVKSINLQELYLRFQMQNGGIVKQSERQNQNQMLLMECEKLIYNMKKQTSTQPNLGTQLQTQTYHNMRYDDIESDLQSTQVMRPGSDQRFSRAKRIQSASQRPSSHIACKRQQSKTQIQVSIDPHNITEFICSENDPNPLVKFTSQNISLSMRESRSSSKRKTRPY